MRKMLICLLILLQNSLCGAKQAEEISAYWDGTYFYPCDKGQIPRNSHAIEGKTFFFKAGHVACYGHALLDGVLPLYALLKEYDLLQTPINLFIPADAYEQTTASFRNITQLVKDLFQNANIVVLNPAAHQKKNNRGQLRNPVFFRNLLLHQHVPLAGTSTPGFAFYRACPESFQYIYRLKEFGLAENVIYKDTDNKNNIVKEFVNYVKAAYSLDLPMKKNRVLITNRPYSRKILNSNQLITSLRNNGFEVVFIDFEQLSIKQQIIETMQSEYMIGTYGSNLVNAMFLDSNANVVVLWHKYAKYFWSRRYCVIHSAFLSEGVTLIEFDKPDYDFRDNYPESIHVPEYFVRMGNMNVLRPEKIDMDSIIQYPLDAMYEITNVDMYIEPEDLIHLIKKSKDQQF